MRATGHDHKGHSRGAPFDAVVLAHDERVLRRKLLIARGGWEVLVDLAQTVAFETGDVLILEDGRLIEVIAADEELYEIRGRDSQHLAELIWHIGNRHLPCQIEMNAPRALIVRDRVIRDMLEGLGATVTEILGPFSPLRGAYGNAHGHDHHHEHTHAHG